MLISNASRPSRRLLLAAALAASATGLGAGADRAAAAGAVAADLDLRVGPVMRHVAARPRPMTARMRLRLTREGGQDPAVLDRVTMGLPYGATLNGRLFPACLPRELLRKGTAGCPRGSEIGRGRAVGHGDTVVQRVTVTVFNGAGGRSMILHLRGYSPALIDEPLVVPLRRHRGGSVQYTVRVEVPDVLQVVAGIPIGVDVSDITIDGTRRLGGRRRGYIEASICPPGAQAPVPTRFEFLDAPRLDVRAWARCG